MVPGNEVVAKIYAEAVVPGVGLEALIDICSPGAYVLLSKSQVICRPAPGRPVETTVKALPLLEGAVEQRAPETVKGKENGPGLFVPRTLML